MEAKANRKFKDTLFTDLFYVYRGAEKNLLSFYNAMYDTDYKDPSIIQKVRLEDVLFMNFKNDLAFTVEKRKIILNEHQSTVNPNMPLRKLMYAAREYEMMVPVKDRYRSSLIKIATPEFITLYNGNDDYPDEQILRLSDAFLTEEASPKLELVDRVLNINPGHNEKLKDKCPVLKGYMELVESTRNHGNDENALEKAIKECIKKGILVDYLLERGSEVINMLMAEYDYEMDMEVRTEEGELNKLKEQVRKKLAKGKSPETIADELEEEDLSVIRKLIDEIRREAKSRS